MIICNQISLHPKSTCCVLVSDQHKRKIYTLKYKKSSDLFQDMELVFTNAMKYNKPNAIWYTEGERLLHIVKALKKKKVIHGKTTGNLEIAFNPIFEMDEPRIRSCTQCNNIMIPRQFVHPKRCESCSTDIKSEQPVYICYNHADEEKDFCNKCVARFCHNECQQVKYIDYMHVFIY